MSVYATEASDFVQKQSSDLNGGKKVHITVKKEHTEEYQQPIGDTMVPAITYGYGDLKLKGERKTRITYICLLNEKCEPFWCFIFPSK